MNIYTFDLYLIFINLCSFLFFRFTMRKRMDQYDTILTLLSLLFGSAGLILSILLYAQTPSRYKKQVMMSRVFVGCMFVIQTILIIYFHGWLGDTITFNVLAFIHKYPHILSYWIGISILTFLSFGLDKALAIFHRWRLPIVLLLGLCAIGGGIGGWIGMYTFHHKTKQDYFVIGVPLILVTHGFLLLFFMNVL